MVKKKQVDIVKKNNPKENVGKNLVSLYNFIKKTLITTPITITKIEKIIANKSIYAVLPLS